MRRRVDITYELVSEWTAEVRGHRVKAAIEKAGVPSQFAYAPISGGTPCWTIPAHAVHQLHLAAVRMRGKARDVTSLWDAA
jgi:hypothetical protein